MDPTPIVDGHDECLTDADGMLWLDCKRGTTCRMECSGHNGCMSAWLGCPYAEHDLETCDKRVGCSV